ncbi:MAG: hypothetical protein EA396_01865 [Anaerolineaceae bacterium]|nr:MAG: hypothetical protein EA396_01865 [Anaerolineaceae bacterium]
MMTLDRHTYIGCALLVLLVAACLRLYGLGTYPPGPHYDEAANILITRSIALDGANMFPIAPSYQGRESLYFYMAAPLFRAVQAGDFTLRVTSAFSNLITIAAAMTLGRLMFGGRRGLVIGLAVGVSMAISFHMMFMGRQAYRAVTLPMMQALGLLFLWRGLYARRMTFSALWLALGGAFSAGALYTYMSSRLFPLWLVLAALVLLWADRHLWRLRLAQGAVFFAALALFAVPMASYALDNPDIFLQRLTEVQDGEVTVTLAESVRRHALMFFIEGDYGNLRYNIPGRPYFTWIEAPLLLIGGWLAVRGAFTARDGRRRAAYALIALSPLMIAPSVVAVAGFPPSHMRSLGMVPLIFLMVGVGAAFVLERIKPRWILPALLAGLLIGGGAVGWQYAHWARGAELFRQADADLAEAARWLDENAADRPVYVAAFHRQHPTIIALYDGAVTWLGADSLILPPPDVEGVVIFAQAITPPAAWRDYLQPIPADTIPSASDGVTPAFGAYTVRGTPPEIPPSAPSNRYITLLSASAPAITAGESGALTLVWHINADVPFYSLRPVVRLRDPSGVELALTDPFLLDTQTWRAGETIIQNIRLDVPSATPPADYAIEITWVDRATDTFLNSVNPDGTSAGIVMTLPDVVRVVASDIAPNIRPPRGEMVTVADGVTLLGWGGFVGRDGDMPQYRGGERLTVPLYWQASPASGERADVTVTARLGDDIPLPALTWAHPPARWRDGEINRVYASWSLPRDLAAGDYALVLEAGTLTLTLGSIRVDGQPRLLTPPPVAERVGAVYGDEIALYGYTWTQNGDSFTLELVWHALRPPQTSYTVFVHLVDSAGQILDQRDAIPQNYDYPTDLWESDEYVRDVYVFDRLPDDLDAVLIGLYDQLTGGRLYVSPTPDGIIHDYIPIKIPMRER